MGVPELPPSHVEDIMAPGMGSLQVQQAGDVQEDDVSGLPFRHIVFRIGNNPTSEPLVSANLQGGDGSLSADSQVQLTTE